jgi:heme-degrading monooxygenase HmoA
MFTAIWEYEVAEHDRPEFERVYAATGAWAQLFRHAAGYLESILLRDVARPGHYVTFDRWQSRLAYDAFLALESTAYAALDEQTSGLTIAERQLGVIEE